MLFPESVHLIANIFGFIGGIILTVLGFQLFKIKKERKKTIIIIAIGLITIIVDLIFALKIILT